MRRYALYRVPILVYLFIGYQGRKNDRIQPSVRQGCIFMHFIFVFTQVVSFLWCRIRYVILVAPPPRIVKAGPWKYCLPWNRLRGTIKVGGRWSRGGDVHEHPTGSIMSTCVNNLIVDMTSACEHEQSIINSHSWIPPKYFLFILETARREKTVLYILFKMYLWSN